MNISDYLLEIATSFDRHAGMGTPAQRLLRDADQALSEHVPAGIEIIGSGGKAVATHTPWVGFFDPDETSTPQRGLYLVYLFAADMRSATLSLMQGITELSQQMGPATARAHLAADAEALRDALGETLLSGLSPTMDLATSGWRQRAYEAGNVVAVRYELDALPPESALRADLARLLALYEDAVVTKRRLLQQHPGMIATASLEQQTGNDDPLRDFRPKSDAEYIAHISGRRLRKSRRHEALVRQYGEWAGEHGFACSTVEHPVDLLLRRDGRQWLVEAEALFQRRAADAVREAVGQLLEYRHFIYSEGPHPSLVALFSAPVGLAFVTYLESLGIASVWREDGKWQGSESARAEALCQEARRECAASASPR